MFKCQKCEKLTEPGEKSNKLVISKREQTYDVKDKWGNVVRESTGWEINKEITICDDCFEQSEGG